ncbi:RibD family protein [Lyngbya sp. CCY1209]|uniref:RibD family protein n=1 Tax=Lyngbya sp. CCY1209 TaxID=2886103 RepID=UPI002D1FFA41|nr:RibD family protein [Lyngbya sp. CCY1209]MEB3884587.1 RibD family protein [Lyngbya sp. CCY1209]
MPTIRPHTTVILAMSADGKIADRSRSPARFGSTADRAHLERQVARADGVLFGNGTLAAYGTTFRVSSSELWRDREKNGKPPQPVQVLCSASGDIDRALKFFKQPVPRWLLTTAAGGRRWQDGGYFDRVIVASDAGGAIAESDGLRQLAELGLERVAVLGGGQLVGSLAEMGAIDELWLTVCPLILGGTASPSPVGGTGFLSDLAPRLELLDLERVEDEVFLHYRVKSTS